MKKDGKKLVTGYILYSSDVRKTVAAQNPESNFGDVSRIVGNEVSVTLSNLIFVEIFGFIY